MALSVDHGCNTIDLSNLSSELWKLRLCDLFRKLSSNDAVYHQNLTNMHLAITQWHQTMQDHALNPTKLSDQVCLVYNDAIRKGQLLHCFILNPFGFLFMQVLQAVFGIHHGDYAILVSVQMQHFKSGCGNGVFFQALKYYVHPDLKSTCDHWKSYHAKNDLSRTYKKQILENAWKCC